MAQKTATVVVVDDNDSFSEHLEAMQNAYGCSGVMVSPRQQDPITPNALVITWRDGWYNWAKKQSYPFSVRFVTFKVAMEMVEINKEEGFE